MNRFDIAIVGGGIVGLATGYQILRRWPNRRIILFEKESHLATHQTGRNSGVIHSGIYYVPGSLKAINCRAGKAQLEAFCATEGVPFERCGKVIVALNDAELPALERIYQRGMANGVDCTMIDAETLREREPHVAGIRAIWVRETGIVDYVAMAERLAEHIRQRDGVIRTNTRVLRVIDRSNGVIVVTQRGEVEVNQVVNCAGLHCDRVAKASGTSLGAQIVPFRGEYFALRPAAEHLCRHLIYPVPDPQFPFLGVHFTRMIAGGVECGPNAVLAFAREGYRKYDVNIGDLWETLTYPGFQKIALRHWRAGLGEMWRSWSKAAFVRALQRLIPAIQAEDLLPIPAGIRAQAVGRNGQLIDDFLIRRAGAIVHVGNAPSPAATASLQIGQSIAEMLQ